ncbi:hypothetical protein [Saccharibacillus alkalitolerans]|uniref:Lipoprotein n=1 Tax=Saccharibacillus alkalitolerans TaxID=2705290 RepID=A0ABX0F233_9BACL|nr:hypothetical protein [Saccharibacillus alkalitolerans]NGZ74500.1 hypothetical protein [Saccharibacillus alkalitolerans]
MDNAKSFMMLAAVFLLFIGACTYAAEVARTIDEGTSLVYGLNAEEVRKVKTVLDAPGEEVYSGAQVVHMIRNIAEGGADIEVEGRLYVCTMDYETLDPAQIGLQHKYRASYQRDAYGNLNKIVFRG